VKVYERSQKEGKKKRKEERKKKKKGEEWDMQRGKENEGDRK